MAVSSSGLYEGPWLNASHRYLGLTLVIDGQTHFGWARLSVGPFYNFSCIATLEGYAYETIPGMPIRAGETGPAADASAEPGTLGSMALGAPGLKPRKEPGRE